MHTFAVVLFLLSAAVLFYVTLGYPICWRCTAARRRAIRKEFIARPVSVIMPSTTASSSYAPNSNRCWHSTIRVS